MNKHLKILAKCAVIFFITACSSAGDPASYNNEMMAIINANEQHITKMNAAMNAKDYTKASEIRETWEAALQNQQEQIEKLGDFDGDATLKKGILAGLNVYQKIVEEDYAKLIEIRSSGKEDITGETTALNHINAAFEEAAQAVNTAGTAFKDKHAQ